MWRYCFDTPQTLLGFPFALSFQSVHWGQQVGGWEQGIAGIHSEAQLMERN